MPVSCVYANFLLFFAVHQAPVTVGVDRVSTATTLLAKKKGGRGGGNSDAAQPRERKEKDDVIEVNIIYLHQPLYQTATIPALLFVPMQSVMFPIVFRGRLGCVLEFASTRSHYCDVSCTTDGTSSITHSGIQWLK